MAGAALGHDPGTSARRPGIEQPVQQQGLGQTGPLERGQVQALVRAVRPGVGVLHAGDEDLGVGEDLSVAGDERDRAAAANIDGRRSPGLGESPARGLVRRSLGSRRIRGSCGAEFHGHVHAPGRMRLQMGCQRRARPGHVLTGGHPQAHLGPGGRDERVGGRRDRRGVDADDRDRGPRPEPLGEPAGSDQPHPVEHRRIGAQLRLGQVDRIRRAADQARHSHVPLLIVQRG